MSRREFLEEGGKALAVIAGAVALVPALPSLMELAFAAEATSDEILVNVFLRGACDGLNFVPPIAGTDRAIYEAERPTIRIPIQGDKAALRLDERFGLHPSAKPLQELYQSRKLAIVHAVGQDVSSRSHFDAQNYMDLGTPGKKDGTSGWLARYLQSAFKPSASGTLTAVAVGALSPMSLLSYPRVTVVSSLAGFNLGGKQNRRDAQMDALKKMYEGNAWVDRFGQETLEAIRILDRGNGKDDYAAENGAEYPKGDIGNRLKTLAQMIKMNLGIQVASVDMGGWDTHKNQGSVEGQFSNLVAQLSQSLRAFVEDLGTRRVTVLVMSEFGRRVKENANRGTDHGHGNIMLALGEHIRGGQVYGRFPGVDTESLYERADLPVTTDYRSVVAEVLEHRSAVGNHRPPIDRIFPGLKYTPLGICAA